MLDLLVANVVQGVTVVAAHTIPPLTLNTGLVSTCSISSVAYFSFYTVVASSL